MGKKSRDIYQELKGALKEIPKWRRIALEILCLAAAGYAAGILWLLPRLSVNPAKMPYWQIKIAAAVIFFAIFYTIFLYFSIKWNNKNLPTVKTLHLKRYETAAFFIGMGITLLVLLVYWHAFFPGSMGPDNVTQWNYVQTGRIDDWHPALHTMMIWLAARVVNHYGFVVLVQMVLFAAVCGYLLKTMAHYRMPYWTLVVSEALIVCNPHTARLYLYLLKDSAFTIFVMLLFIFLLHIFMSKGAWLAKGTHVVLLSVTVICTGILRFNGIFLSISSLILLFVLLKGYRKQVLLTAVVVIAGTWLIKYPLYEICGVQKMEKQGFTEAIGLPLTIMGNIKAQAPERLSAETNAFLDEAVEASLWQKYEMGNFNSVKWYGATDVIEDVKPEDFTRMAVDTIWNNKAYAIQAFTQLTRMVWAVNGDMNWNSNDKMYIYENPWGYEYREETQNLRWMLDDWNTYLFRGIEKYIFCYIGIYILILMGVMLVTFLKHGARIFYMVLPILAYNFGTMLLLNGPDFRYFYFNFLVTAPICFGLLLPTNDEKERA